MKKFFVLVLTVLIVGLAILPQVYPQSQEQMEAQNKLFNDLLEGKITYGQFLQQVTEIMNAPLQTTAEAAQLIVPEGKAWVIQDNQVQGSGEAMVFKADGGFEGYERRLGIWRPNMDNDYSTTTYAATGNRISIRSDDDYYASYTGEYDYTISGGSTLTITYDEWASGGNGGAAAGTYTLSDFPKIAAPGGSIINPAGTAWEISNKGGHDIYHSDGIRYSFGNSVRDPWNFLPNEIWKTYIVPSAGALTCYYHDQRNNKPEQFSYSVTDFGNGNKTLRMWRIDRMFPYDEVWKLVPVPSGFQLPKVR